MKNYKDLVLEGAEKMQSADKLLKHPMVKGQRKPKKIEVEDDLSGVTVEMLDWGKFRVGQDGGAYYIEKPNGDLILGDLVMTQLAPAVAALLKMGV